MGIAFSVRALPSLWIGAGFLGGRATIHEVVQDNKTYRYDTDYVFSPQLEVSYAVLTTRYGQWLFSALPAYFVTTGPGDNNCLYVPLAFGLRGF